MTYFGLVLGTSSKLHWYTIQTVWTSRADIAREHHTIYYFIFSDITHHRICLCGLPRNVGIRYIGNVPYRQTLTPATGPQERTSARARESNRRADRDINIVQYLPLLVSTRFFASRDA